MSKSVILLGMVTSILGLVFFFNAMFLTYETIKYPDYATAATTSVTVSAQIVGLISCSSATDTTTFASWTGGDTSIKTSSPSPTTTMSCTTSAGGCTLNVKDVGSTTAPGLWNSSASELIESPNAAYDASTTLNGGVEGYGIKAATNTAGSGADLGIQPRYRNTGANDIGGLTITNTTIASSTATTSGREIETTHMAAIAVGTPSGSYTDTITYECIEN